MAFGTAQSPARSATAGRQRLAWPSRLIHLRRTAMPMIEVDQETDEYLKFAASIAGVSKGQVVAQLVAERLSGLEGPSKGDGKPDTVPIHAFYEGHHTEALYY